MATNFSYLSAITQKVQESIEQESIVYDMSYINYRNNDKKERAWREIAEELNREGRLSRPTFPLLQYVADAVAAAKYGTVERC